MNSLPKIIIIGGGAGGLELVTALGHTLGKSHQAVITLVDSFPTHVWKPLLHEVAAGVLDATKDELSYLTHSRNNYYQFEWGRFSNIDRKNKTITLDPIYDLQNKEIIPKRQLNYDILVIAVGSVTADFNIPGVAENCLFLDSRDEADYFHQQLLASLFRSHYQLKEQQLIQVCIVGGGATGVELAAELRYTLQQASRYGLEDLNYKPEINIIIIEGAERILAALPERISKMTARILEKLNITVLAGERVTKVTHEGIETASGKFIPATLKVWAAGIKAPTFLSNLDGLETNKQGQLMVTQTLQTTVDNAIFALGDCASCLNIKTGKPVPPRAQAAHQQASLLVKSIKNYLEEKPLLKFVYNDYGSLVSLSKYDAIGNLMGKLTSVMIEGKIARFIYLSLYKMHLVKIYGIWKTILLSISNVLTRKVKPPLKLH